MAENKTHLIYLVQGHSIFQRLVSVVLDEIQGISYRPVDPEDLSKAMGDDYPDLVLILDNEPLYRRIRAENGLNEVPILFVVVSDTDAGKWHRIGNSDYLWELKNDAAELSRLLSEILPARRRNRILCVDDSPIILNQLRKAFSNTPYLVSTASNGREGLDRARGSFPDLIITDVEMPVMNGLEFCSQIRKFPGAGEIPLIILSSRVDYDTITAGFECGADEYLTKPFHPDELLNKVESFLAPPPARRKEHVLIVGDQPNVLRQVKLALSAQGVETISARTAAEALAQVQRYVPDLIISDQNLPEMSGFQFCTQIRSLPEYRRVPVVLVTDKTSYGARKMGERAGVTAYLTKPFTRENVVVLVERLLAENRSLKALEWDMVLASITSLAKALDERDTYTRFHSENVARYAVAIGRKAGFNLMELENLRLAGLLHDIGKIGIPDIVLHKPGRLSAEEFDRIKEHSRLGAEILKPIHSLEGIIPGILHHHERIDGNGYPHGLSGEAIPIKARILAVADTYDALVTDRPYRKGMPQEKAVRIMRDVAGTQLSSRYVRLFLEWLENSNS